MSPARSSASARTSRTRFTSQRRASRGSRATTTSPRRGARRPVYSKNSPSRSAGDMLCPATAMRPTITRGLRGDGLLHPRLLGTAELLPHVADLVDHVDQFLRLGDVEALLHLRALLRCLPADLVQIRELLHVLRLEVVVPQHVDVMLRELRALLLHDDAALAELLVVRGVVLLEDLVAGLRFDARLVGIVNAAWDVAVRVRHMRWREQTTNGLHAPLLRTQSSGRAYQSVDRDPLALARTSPPGSRPRLF